MNPFITGMSIVNPQSVHRIFAVGEVKLGIINESVSSQLVFKESFFFYGI